jgi:hypothetical protein
MTSSFNDSFNGYNFILQVSGFGDISILREKPRHPELPSVSGTVDIADCISRLAEDSSDGSKSIYCLGQSLENLGKALQRRSKTLYSTRASLAQKFLSPLPSRHDK